jgi:hypothetical protein
MALIDPFEALELLEYWRFCLATAIGAGIGLAIYLLAGRTPDLAAVALFLGAMGAVVGFAWEYGHRHRPPDSSI